MKPLRVTVKVRNNYLLKAIEAAGYEPGAKVAEAIGISYMQLRDYVNMARAPFDRNGAVREEVEKLINFLGVPFDELFGEEHSEALATNKAEREVFAEDVFTGLLDGTKRDPMMMEDMKRCLGESMQALTVRERRVIDMRFGLGDETSKTFEEIGEVFGVSKDRIRQIEAKALRKLRSPAQAGRLREFVGEETPL